MITRSFPLVHVMQVFEELWNTPTGMDDDVAIEPVEVVDPCASCGKGSPVLEVIFRDPSDDTHWRATGSYDKDDSGPMYWDSVLAADGSSLTWETFQNRSYTGSRYLDDDMIMCTRVGEVPVTRLEWVPVDTEGNVIKDDAQGVQERTQEGHEMDDLGTTRRDVLAAGCAAIGCLAGMRLTRPGPNMSIERMIVDDWTAAKKRVDAMSLRERECLIAAVGSVYRASSPQKGRATNVASFMQSLAFDPTVTAMHVKQHRHEFVGAGMIKLWGICWEGQCSFNDEGATEQGICCENQNDDAKRKLLIHGSQATYMLLEAIERSGAIPELKPHMKGKKRLLNV